MKLVFLTALITVAYAGSAMAIPSFWKDRKVLLTCNQTIATSDEESTAPRRRLVIWEQSNVPEPMGQTQTENNVIVNVICPQAALIMKHQKNIRCVGIAHSMSRRSDIVAIQIEKTESGYQWQNTKCETAH
jgi:hypothetical protein